MKSILLPSRVPNACIMQDHEALRSWIVTRRISRVDHVPNDHALNPQIAIRAYKLICLPAIGIRHDERLNHVHDIVLELVLLLFRKIRSLNNAVFDIPANVVHLFHGEAGKPIFSDDFAIAIPTFRTGLIPPVRVRELVEEARLVELVQTLAQDLGILIVVSTRLQCI